MGIRFSIPEFLLTVVIAPGLPAYTKKDPECNGTVKGGDYTTVVRNATKSKAGKECGDYGKRIGSQGNYAYTCNVHS